MSHRRHSSRPFNRLTLWSPYSGWKKVVQRVFMRFSAMLSHCKFKNEWKLNSKRFFFEPWLSKQFFFSFFFENEWKLNSKRFFFEPWLSKQFFFSFFFEKQWKFPKRFVHYQVFQFSTFDPFRTIRPWSSISVFYFWPLPNDSSMIKYFSFLLLEIC